MDKKTLVVVLVVVGMFYFKSDINKIKILPGCSNVTASEIQCIIYGNGHKCQGEVMNHCNNTVDKVEVHISFYQEDKFAGSAWTYADYPLMPYGNSSFTVYPGSMEATNYQTTLIWD